MWPFRRTIVIWSDKVLPTNSEMTMDDRLPTDLDVVVVGAGIAGIDAAYHLSRSLPGKRLAAVDAHETLGGA